MPWSYNRPVQLSDTFEVDGAQVPRIFVSARGAEGLSTLRTQLASIVTKAYPLDGPSESAAHLNVQGSDWAQ